MSFPERILPSSLLSAVESQCAVLFLGAAASFGSQHPKGAKIPGGADLRDAISDRFLGGEEKTKPLATVAELAINEASLTSLQQFVREIFLGFKPADFHCLIPRFRWHGIATTNYDLIIERAYDPNNNPLQELVPFVKNGQAVETQMKKAVDGVQYLKLHGCIDHYIDNEIPLVLSREQYSRYSINRTRLFERFQDWGREFPIIFCGYSVSDPHIQSILFNLIDLGDARPMYFIVDPNASLREERYWSSRRITTIRATFEQFIVDLHASVSNLTQILPKGIGGGTSTVRKYYKVANAPETKDLLFFLEQDVEHVRNGMPIGAVSPKEFYRGVDDGWGAMAQNLDVSRAITDSLVSDAILSNEEERSSLVDLYAVKGPAGNGKTIVLKRAAWMAAHDYEKICLFFKQGGAIRSEVIEELYRYTQERLFLFVDRAALFVEELERLINFARVKRIRLTLIVAERDAEWNVRCENLDRFGFRDFQVRYLSESEIRSLLKKLEEHDSLGLLKEISNFEDRVKRLLGPAQRQFLVALHEATLGKAFEDIVYDEYHRILPTEAQAMYLDICTLNRLGVVVRAGLIARVSGIGFTDFEKRLFRPLEHIVKSFIDTYIGDHVYTARHQHVAEMVFDRVLAEPEARFDQIIRIMNGMNLDYASDRSAFGQLIRGHSISDSLRSRALGRAFYDAATKIAPREAFLFQQRAIFEMEAGGDLLLAENHLEQARRLDSSNRSIQHSFAVLWRKQALASQNSLLRRRLRDRANSTLANLLGGETEYSYAYHTAGQIALDDLRDLLAGIGSENVDPLAERRIVEIARDFERYVQEGLQKVPLNVHLLALESEYRQLVDDYRQAETALTKAFNANPRQEWIAIRLSRTLDSSGRSDEAKSVLLRCLQDNPTSKKAHYELAMIYIRERGDSELIIDHLRRSFTSGDKNYDAQFWYAREMFLSGKISQSNDLFKALRNVNMSPDLRNQVRGIVEEGEGRNQVYRGEVASIEDAYMFVRCPDFSENIFVHRTRAGDNEWALFTRGRKVFFTLGFSMRGPTAASISPVD